MHARIAILGAIALVVIAAVGIAVPAFLPMRYESASAIEKKQQEEIATPPAVSIADTREIVEHVPLPSAVKTIYMTACVVGTHPFREEVVGIIDRTEVNSVIIDIKDYSGTISFPPTSPVLKPAWDAAKCGARDMREFIALLHKKGIYVIGRITVFQDPLATAARPDLAVKKASDGSVWKDHKGLSFIDVGARAHWDYIDTLAIESYNIGFDELNFDYIRFPSDGNMKDIAFTHAGAGPKQEALEKYFEHLSKEMHDPARFAEYKHVNTGKDTAAPYISADLFGMTTTNTDDLNIGQVLERALPYFDFVAPMVYPSHYPSGFMGFADPNDHVYDVVHHAMGAAVRRAQASTTSIGSFVHERIGTSTPPVYKKPIHDIQKLRTWIQDFDYGGDYGPTEVRAQIQATYDVGLTSWMIWAPSNRYTEGGLEKGP